MIGTVHFICGPTGAGKTTYAVRLASEIRAVRLSIDSWMAALFWPDRSDPIDPEWAQERVERCRQTIWRTAVEVARTGTEAVVEIGLTTRNLRDRFATVAEQAGVPARFHFVDADREERWRRVEARNAKGGELDFPISREMFDYVERAWEPLHEAERSGRDTVAVAT